MPTLSSLIVLFFILGVSSGMSDVAMNSQAVMVEKQMQKPIMTSFHALFSIGMALGAFAGAFLSVTKKYGITCSFYLCFYCQFSHCLRGQILSRSRQAAASKSTEEPAFRVPNAAMASIGVIAFCSMLGEGAMADWSTNYM